MGGWNPDFTTKYQSIVKVPTMKRVTSLTESDFEYEHFPVVCPTCEGQGEICEDSHGLVTFVPVKDKRLKPAWTKLKVVMLIVVLLGTGGLATYFLYPRTVEFHVSAHNILDFSFQGKYPWMEYSFDVAIKNNNFFAVTLCDIVMNLSFVKKSISKLKVGCIHVAMRGEVLKIVTMNASYADDIPNKYLRRQCYEERDYVGQLMKTSGELDYWVHSEHIESRDDYFYTNCGSLVFPLVVKTTPQPTTTTTATTTNTTPNTTSTTATTTMTTTTTSPTTTTKEPTKSTITGHIISMATQPTTTTPATTTTKKATTTKEPTRSTITGHIISMATQSTTMATTAEATTTKEQTKSTITGHIISMATQPTTTTPATTTSEQPTETAVKTTTFTGHVISMETQPTTTAATTTEIITTKESVTKPTKTTTTINLKDDENNRSINNAM